MKTRDPQRFAAFTLIELLVVISIIALLIAILLPALSKARASGRLVNCKSNLKQQGIGLHTYTNDYREFLPYAKNFAWQYSSEDPSMPYIQNVMAPYIEGDDPGNRVSAAYRCPSVDAGYGESWLRDDPTATHYRYNTDMAIRYGPTMPLSPPTTSLDQVKSPTEARFSYDVAFSNWYDNGIRNGSLFAHDEMGVAVNAAYLDGHVEGFTLDEWDELTDSTTGDFEDEFSKDGWL